MPNYRIDVSEEDFNAASKRKKKIEELYDALDGLREDYEKRGQTGELPPMDLPEELELTRVEYDKKSREELKKQAEAENAEKYRGKAENLERQAAEKNRLYASRMEDEAEAAARRQEEVDELYAERKKSAENQALKRGLARSSIIMAQLEAFDQGRIGDKLTIGEEARKQIIRLQESIDAANIELERAKAANDGDMQNAVESRLMKLLDEQEEKYLQAVKFNNDVAAKEADYARQREAAILARNKAAMDADRNRQLYGSEIGKGEYLKRKFDVVRDYLDGMDSKKALSVLKNDRRLREELGTYYTLMRKYLESK